MAIFEEFRVWSGKVCWQSCQNSAKSLIGCRSLPVLSA